MRPGRPETYSAQSRLGRLQARPVSEWEEAALGMQPIVVGGERVGLLHAPSGYATSRPAPVAVMLHGAGGHAEQGMGLLRQLADDAGLILVALDSVGPTWDVIHTRYGPDVARLDAALGVVFGHFAVDPGHLAIGGFSDGASYALSIGITNGDLFTHLIAFSPGFLAPAGREGRPAIFVSHGTADQVLPIDRTSRRLVPSLREAGYAVEYVEFDGPHTVPPSIALASLAWFLPPGYVTRAT